MSDEENRDLEFAASLIHYDEALRAGEVPTIDIAAIEPSRHSVQLSDLALAQWCLQELEAALPRPRIRTRSTLLAHMPAKIGRFKLIKVLGSGGFAVVYLAQDPWLDRQVALKVPRWHALAAADLRRRFVREAQAAAQLDHPHIAPTYEAGEDGDLPYIALAYCSGPTLAEWLRERNEPMAPRAAAQLVVQLAEAVQHSHQQGILHRDIKPANVLLFPSSEVFATDFPYVPRLADFGLAKVIKAESEDTVSSMVLGTPVYMSPEQALGRHAEVGPRSDVYALGGVLFALLTGRPPFLAANLVDTLRQVAETEPVAPATLNPAIEQDLSVICLKCLEKSPARRYATAQELAEDLKRYLAHETIHARASSALNRGWRWCRRKPAVAGLLAGVAGLALCLIATLVWHSYSTFALNQAIEQRNVQLTEVVVRLNESLLNSTQQQQLAEENERRAKQLLYAANLQLAAEAWRKNDLRSAARLLERHTERDAEFAWRYLRDQVTPRSRPIAQVEQTIWYAIYSPDGRWYAVAGNRGAVQIFDVSADYRLSQTLETSQIEVNGLAFSPDSQSLATAGDDGRVGVWNVATWEPIHWLNVIPGAVVYGVAFLDEGRQVVACGRSPELSLWEVASGERIKTWETPHARTIESLAVSPDGLRLASAGAEGLAAIYRLDQDSPEHVLADGSGPVTVVEFSKDGQWLISGHSNGFLRLHDVATGKLRYVEHRPDGISALAVGAEGWVAFGDREGAISLLRLPESALDPSTSTEVSQPDSTAAWPIQRVWSAGNGRIGGLTFAPDQDALIAGDAHGTIQMWPKLSALRQDHRVVSQATRALSDFDLGCGKDASQMYCVGEGGLEIWNSRQRRLIATITHESPITACDYQCGTHSLLLGDQHGRIGQLPPGDTSRIDWWDLDLFGDLAITRVDSCANDRYHLAQCYGGDIVVLAADTKTERKRLANCAAFAGSPDGRWLVVGRHGTNDFIVLSTDTFEMVHQFAAHRSTIWHVEFSRDGQWLLSVSGDRTAVIWETSTWQPRHTLLGHLEPITAGAISPDGRTIATGDESGVVKLWDTDSGQELLDMTRQAKEVSALAFSADGEVLYVFAKHHWVAVHTASHVDEVLD